MFLEFQMQVIQTHIYGCYRVIHDYDNVKLRSLWKKTNVWYLTQLLGTYKLKKRDGP